MEKLFYVKPGIEPNNIQVMVSGAKSLSVNDRGELEVETSLGIVKFTKPVAYQEKDSKKKYIEVAYAVNGDRYGFKLDN